MPQAPLAPLQRPGQKQARESRLRKTPSGRSPVPGPAAPAGWARAALLPDAPGGPRRRSRHPPTPRAVAHEVGLGSGAGAVPTPGRVTFGREQLQSLVLPLKRRFTWSARAEAARGARALSAQTLAQDPPGLLGRRRGEPRRHGQQRRRPIPAARLGRRDAQAPETHCSPRAEARGPRGPPATPLRLPGALPGLRTLLRPPRRATPSRGSGHRGSQASSSPCPSVGASC